MKLPQSKKGRQQVFILAGIASAAIIFLVWSLVYQPLLSRRAEEKGKTEALENQIVEAEMLIRRIPSMEQELRNAITNLLFISGREMLRSEVQNHFSLAMQILDDSATELGLRALTRDDCEDLGIVSMPKAKERGRPKAKGEAKAATPEPAASAASIQAYGIRVNTRCSYYNARRWIKKIEDANNHAVVSAIKIDADAADPENHPISFEVYWPVWIDLDMHENLKKKAAGITDGGGAP